jgi:hypothetical protein
MKEALESELEVPNRNIEPAIASIGAVPDVRPELKGGYAQLAKKGTIRFTSYETTERE